MQVAFSGWERDMVEPLWGGNAPAFTSTNLVRNPSATRSGYELEKTESGYGYMVYELRKGLSLAEDWELIWNMESVSKSGYGRNGFVVVGDDLLGNRFVRAGVTFGTGTTSINELQNGNATSAAWPAIAAGATNEFRLQYEAVSRRVTFRYGANTVSLVLTGTYDGDVLDCAGLALNNSALTRFSPVVRHSTPRAAPVTPTWARMKVARDYVAGTYDTNGCFMGGTELMSLVSHKGRLFAGVGYWNDMYWGSGSPDPYPGAQVLVKNAWNAPWRQDAAFGANHLRVECLRSIAVTTDKNGAPLNPPVTLLLAGSGEMGGSPRRAVVFVRNDSNDTWTATYPGSAMSGSATTRMIFDHVDRSLPTSVHCLFVGYGGADANVVRGGYNAATGLIDWDVETELTGTHRILSAGECNGHVYACIGSDNDPTNNIGGVFWRQDGTNAQWHFVHEWADTGEQNPDIRGFTAVPHPRGFGYDVALVTLEAYGVVYCIDPIGGDPRNGHIVTEEMNIQRFLGDEWRGGASIGFPSLSAYNDMPEVVHPGTRQLVNLIGLGVGYPAADNTPERNSAYYLIRHRDATYEWGRAFDPAVPVPNPTAGGLRATRALRLSPFPEDGGRVLFFGGFDAASQTGPVWHNTAWLYRAELPDETARIALTGEGMAVSFEGACGWEYQAQRSDDLLRGDWLDVGPPLPGSNAVQVLELPLLPEQDVQFYRWRFRRP
jgi:hypothetical protein